MVPLSSSELLVGGGAEFGDLAQRVGIVGRRRLELAQLGSMRRRARS